MNSRRFWIPMLFVGIVTGGWLLGDDKDPPPKLKGTLPTNWKKLGLNDDQVQDVYRGFLEQSPDAMSLARQFEGRVWEKYESYLSDDLTAQLFAQERIDLVGAIQKIREI